MFIGQFPSDQCIAVDHTDQITQISSHSRFESSKRSIEKKAPKRPKSSENDPFPKVEDIIDRLTNDTEVADLRVRARS